MEADASLAGIMQAMEMVTGRLIDSAQCTEIILKQLGIGLRGKNLLLRSCCIFFFAL
jgi:hypothetical protein